MNFPKLIYRSPGNRVHLGKTYEYKSVKDEAGLNKALQDGWHLSRKEAIEAAGEEAIVPVKKHSKSRRPARKKKPAKPLLTWRERMKKAWNSIPDDDAPPTRSELETKATTLGIKFDVKESSKALLDRISKMLGG
jgi:hypothetical protein